MFDTWAKASDTTGTNIRILLLDFRKAFDLIDHNILLAKLCSLGVPSVLLRWVHAFLMDRNQRIKIGETTSDWCHVHGGVPQGTKLGPLLFITMINDMELELPTIKYVDDTTLYEVIHPEGRTTEDSQSLTPNLQDEANKVLKWAQQNHMELNAKKTKEMLITFGKQPSTLASIEIDGHAIDRVQTSKLLGVHISSDLKWDKHVESIHSKASSRIFFLCVLKRTSLSTTDLVSIYTSTIRPLLEYACQLWHSGITNKLSNMLESIQRRSLRIIFPGLSYEEALVTTNLPRLSARRMAMCQTMFRSMQDEGHRLHHLLPPAKDNKHTLRNLRKFEPPRCRTSRYKDSFVPYCLYKLQ